MIGCEVNIRVGSDCLKCERFFESAYVVRIGTHHFCLWCAGKLSAELTQIRWKASEIGHLASSHIGSFEQIGIEAVETALTAITELSNEIQELLNFTQPNKEISVIG